MYKLTALQQRPRGARGARRAGNSALGGGSINEGNAPMGVPESHLPNPQCTAASASALALCR